MSSRNGELGRTLHTTNNMSAADVINAWPSFLVARTYGTVAVDKSMCPFPCVTVGPVRGLAAATRRTNTDKKEDGGTDNAGDSFDVVCGAADSGCGTEATVLSARG